MNIERVIKKICITSLFGLLLLGGSEVVLSANCPTLSDGQVPSPECALQTAKNKVENYAEQSPDSTSPEFYIGEIVRNVLIYIGSIFLILMVYAGGTWMLANGNQDNITKAKSIIKTSIIGLIIVTFAYSIASFVVQRANKIKEPEIFSCTIIPNKSDCNANPTCNWMPVTAATDCKGDLICEGLKSLGFGDKESEAGVCQDR